MALTTSGGAGGVEDGALPWERPIRQISLAARADVLDEMADPWHSYLGTINDCHDQLIKIWQTVLEKQWRGDAANACHGYWLELAKNISTFKSTYDPMPDILKAAGNAVTEATHSIPIPVFANGSLPGGNGTGGAGARVGGGMLYDDYDNDRSGYADYAFLHTAMQEDTQPKGSRGYSGGHYVSRSDENKAYYDQDDLVRQAAVKNWYAEHQNTANQAHDKLVTDYAHTIHNLPHSIGNFRDPAADSDGRDKDSGGHHPRGGDDGSGTAYGAGSFGAVGGAGVGAGAVNASLPTSRHGSIPAPPSSVTDGIHLAGDTNSGGTPGSTTPSRYPLSFHSPTAAGSGSGGAGGFGAVGGGVGFGGVGVPATSVPENGWWSRSPSGAMGPPAASPAAQLAAGRGTPTATTTGANGMGMMPHAGGAGTGNKEERQTWLTEDDEDVFRAKPATPGLIE